MKLSRLLHRSPRRDDDPRCSCQVATGCGDSNTVAGRRRALGLFTALLVTPLSRAQSTSDLLDPSVLNRKASNHTGPDGQVPAAASTGTGVGLAMAESVAASLDGLTSAAAARVTELDRLNKLIDDTLTLPLESVPHSRVTN